MIAIFGGLGAASVFAIATLSASRGTRMIGPRSFLAGVMLVGLVATLPAVAARSVPQIGGVDAGWLVLSGCGNVAGLLCAYAALRLGKVGIVAPIVSTEGAIAAVLAVVAGEGISPGAGATLGVIACGILLSGITRDADEVPADPGGLRALALAIAAALAFGASLYATARVGASLPVAWAVLPARAVGVAAVTLPLAVSRRLTITRQALPFVLCRVSARPPGSPSSRSPRATGSRSARSSPPSSLRSLRLPPTSCSGSGSPVSRSPAWLRSWSASASSARFRHDQVEQLTRSSSLLTLGEVCLERSSDF